MKILTVNYNKRDSFYSYGKDTELCNVSHSGKSMGSLHYRHTLDASEYTAILMESDIIYLKNTINNFLNNFLKYMTK